MTVEIVLRGHNMRISDRLNDYVDKKVGKLDRYLPELKDAQVDLKAHKTARSAEDRKVAQITVRSTRGTILRAEESSADIFAAIDMAVDKLYRQIKRFKGKRDRRRGAMAGADRVADVLVQDEMDVEDMVGEDEEPESAIVRYKRFVTVPMNPEEALEQMQLLGHDNFFVFYNVEDDNVNVLYRRQDGMYGVLVPELG